MKKFLFFLLGLILGIAVIYGVAAMMQNSATVEEENKIDQVIQPTETSEIKETEVSINENISVTKPLADEIISSPVSVEGNAKGTWFFEAVAFVKVVDEKGIELGSGNIKAVGNWMTENFVPFKGQITFSKTTEKTGYLMFQNSNPSGLSSNSQEFKLPIKF